MKAALTAISIVTLVLVGRTGPAGAQGCPSVTPIVLGGQTNLAFVDVNRNGMIDSNDCVVTGVGEQTHSGASKGSSAVQTGNLCFSATQGGPPFLPGCNGAYGGSAYLDPSSGMGMADGDFNSVEIFYSTSPSPSPSPGLARRGAAKGIPGLPVPITSASVFDEGGPVGEGFLCNDSGPAVRAIVRGVNGVARFDPKSIGGVPYACSTLPFPTDMGMQMFPLCVSIGTGSAIQGGLLGGPLFVEFPLTGLGSCGANGAPTANEWGLLALASVLLACGTWVLRRRSAFGAALPTV